MFAALALTMVVPASAQEWPTQPIKFFVAAASGSSPDTIARIVSNELGKALGQQIVIENRPGAAGNLGTEAAARAAPDGSTFLFGQAAPLALNQHVFKDLRFDAQKDFDPVILIGRSEMIIAASPHTNISSLPDLISQAKAAPGKFFFATSSSKNIPHMTGELLKTRAQIDITHVSYRNNPQAAADTIAGTVSLMIDGLPVIMPHVRNKALVALGVTARERLPGIDIPTVSEILPGFEVGGWFAILAPRGTPPNITRKLNASVVAVLRMPHLAQRLRDLGIYSNPENSSPEYLRDFMRAQAELYGKVARSAGILPE